ncbi:helix-turn-helix domain-containing protein [Duganella sp. CY15W]|uniref:helix-turn-helix domain-containing protein n=1 Tax=Duganella sp. CY15W TaxID=2692172 RepID=UPI0013698872|nr:AraC family transcriptional regulator [Duganella sp. CY15W]MYM31677.1 helix-turn-helix domain-containing protein [Duganella sp. CY15W]
MDAAIDTPEVLKDWFHRSGVHDPLRTCIGPLPNSKASIVRWTSDHPDAMIQTVSPHLNDYRIAIMMEPVDARIWQQGRPVWGGVIAAERFRICPPSSASQWSRLSSCDIVNLFVPASLVDSLSDLRQTGVPLALGANQFTSDRYVMETVRRMLNADVMAGPLQSQYCDGLMVALLSYLLEHYSRPQDAAQASTLGGARLRRVLSYMEQHLSEDVTNQQLAGLCAMSPAHFSREFHAALGLPPHRYLMKMRLEKARAMLAAGGHAMADIADTCGFHDASHLSRTFTRHFGSPPARFRQQRGV